MGKHHDHSAIIERLDRLSRRRALTLDESLALERSIRAKRRSYRHFEGRWQPEEDEKARHLREQGWKYVLIASCVRRSPDAVAARLRYLRQRETRP